MTVVAVMSVCDVPVFLGDILTSAPFAPPTPLHLPTRGEVPAALPSRLQPVGVSRKVLWHDPNCLVGFAGPLREAKKLRSRISAMGSGKVDVSSIRKLIDEKAVKAYPGLSLVAMMKQGQSWKIMSSGGDAFVHHVEGLGKVHIAGSGRSALLKILYAMPTPRCSDIDGVRRTLYTLHGALFLTDARSGSSENMLAGGAYEVWFSDPVRGVRPLADHNLVLGVFNSDEGYFELRQAHNIRYRRSKLVLRSARFRTGPQGPFLEDRAIHVATVPGVGPSKQEIREIREARLFSCTELVTSGFVALHRGCYAGCAFLTCGQGSGGIFLHPRGMADVAVECDKRLVHRLLCDKFRHLDILYKTPRITWSMR